MAGELAKKDNKPVAVCANPDICRVDGELVPFDISRDLSGAINYSPDVNGLGAPLLFVSSVIQGVNGNKGQGISSGVAEGCGYVFVTSGAKQIFCNGKAVAWNMSECLMNCDASGLSNGTRGFLYTDQSAPMCHKGGYSLPPTPTPQYELSHKDYTFDNCNDALAKMKQMAKDGKFVAESPWTPVPTQDGGKPIRNPNGTYSFTTSADIKVTATVTMPRWANMPNDPAVVKAWNEMYAALLKHEEGHTKISHKADMHFDAGQIKGEGRTGDEAIADFMAKLLKKVEQVKDGISAEHDEYDAVANHGATQHLVEGKDVVLACPAPTAVAPTGGGLPPGGNP